MFRTALISMFLTSTALATTWTVDASGEDGCQDWYSSVDVQVKMGNSYYIRIGGWQAATGSGTLTIE